jgi:hypothetical protein
MSCRGFGVLSIPIKNTPIDFKVREELGMKTVGDDR